MGAVGASECLTHCPRLHAIREELRPHRAEIALGQHHIAVEDDDEAALSALHAVVPTIAWTTVGLLEILQPQPSSIFLHHVFAGRLATVFHDDNLHILLPLPHDGLQQFVDLVRAVIDGDY